VGHALNHSRNIDVEHAACDETARLIIRGRRAMEPGRIGEQGEERACRFLRRHGYRILERNYRCPFGELDIVAVKGKTLVFCEVKARSSGERDMALAAVDGRRQRRMAKAASHYVQSRGDSRRLCRFDVIALLKEGPRWTIEHIKDAFEVNER
jgi:putative endonuclease